MSPFLKDLLERCARSFIGGLLSVLAANLASVTDLDAAKALGVSALYAGAAAVLAVITKNVGPSDTASILGPPS